MEEMGLIKILYGIAITVFSIIAIFLTIAIRLVIIEKFYIPKIKFKIFRKLRLKLTRYLIKKEIKSLDKHKYFAMSVGDAELRRTFIDCQDELKRVIRLYFRS